MTFVSRDVRFYETIYTYQVFQTSKETEENGTEERADQSVWVESEMENHTVTATNIEEEQQQQASEAVPSPPVRRSNRNHRAPVWHDDYQVSANYVKKWTDTKVSPQFSCFMNKVTKTPDPKNFTEAAQRSHWLQAMNEGLDAPETNQT